VRSGERPFVAPGPRERSAGGPLIKEGGLERTFSGRGWRVR
jgi:hypothetical protein